MKHCLLLDILQKQLRTVGVYVEVQEHDCGCMRDYVVVIDVKGVSYVALWKTTASDKRINLENDIHFCIYLERTFMLRSFRRQVRKAIRNKDTEGLLRLVGSVTADTLIN